MALTAKQEAALDWLYERREADDKARYMIRELWARRTRIDELAKAIEDRDVGTIAGTIPADLAEQVADELHKRLAG